MNRLPPIGSPERAFVVDRLMNDTGFYCRYVLGMDTDRDEKGNCTSEIGKGGVRDFGPHQEVIGFLDDETPGHEYRVIWAPRYSYKSSMVRGLIQRKIIAHPNISILLVMHEIGMAQQRCLEIREDLLNNPILQELFPDMQGKPWTAGKFTTGLRTDKTNDSPTLYVASPQKPVTGTRPNLVIFDDIVTDQNLTENALERARRFVERSLFLGARGCIYIYVSTPQHFADPGHWAIEAGWKKLVHLDIGYDLVVADDKSMDLKGTGTWPNLSREFLLGKLRGGVSFPTFMSQYKLQVVAGTFQAFQRTHFKVTPWNEEMADFTGYLLTDIAQGTAVGAVAKDGGSKRALNVLLYVLVDQRNHVYLADCEVGRWAMLEFCERYLRMLDRWSGKVNHRCEIWEQVHSNTAYASYLSLRSKDRHRRPTFVWQQRNVSVAGKEARINATQVRFQAGEVHVLDTMPRTWADDAETKVLWDPEGFFDVQKNIRLPGGDLVEQFVRFPYHPLRDIPDAFALVDTVDKDTGQRVCFWVRPSRQQVPGEQQRLPMHTARGGATDRFYARIRRR